MTQQLLLGLTMCDEVTLDNFIKGSNEALIANLKQAMNNPEACSLLFYAEKGVGKSHLLQGACHYAHSRGLQSCYLPMAELQNFSVEAFNDLENLDVICLDDIDVIAGNPLWEEALFHLFNRLRDQGKMLFMASSVGINELPLALPDLQSRLRGSLVYSVHPLDDEAKMHALQSHARNLGMTLEEEAAGFLIRRCHRDMTSLMMHLNNLDQASLEAKRPITIPFIKKTLNI